MCPVVVDRDLLPDRRNLEAASFEKPSGPDSVIRAFGTTAPAGSVTTPLSDPSLPCAPTVREKHINEATQRIAPVANRDTDMFLLRGKFTAIFLPCRPEVRDRGANTPIDVARDAWLGM